MCGTLAPMTSRRQIQDGGPHDTKMAAPTTSGPRWRPPRHQDGGPTKSDTRCSPLWRVRLHLGGWVNALDHEKVASRPKARCRSSLYTRGWGASHVSNEHGSGGDYIEDFLRSSERDPVFNGVARRSARFIPFPGWTLFFQHGPFSSFGRVRRFLLRRFHYLLFVL